VKFTVTMKDPDTLHDAITEAVKKSLADLGLDDDELEPMIERRHEKVSDICGKWFEYGEYLRVEIDTEARTCTVLEKKR
jgi:hypothetical protein